MDVTAIVDREFDTYDEATPVSKLRGAFEDTARKTLLITRDGEFEGIVARRDVLSSHEKTSRKARSLLRSVPTIEADEDVREAARLMIAGDTRLLPVLEGDDLVGVVRADDLLGRRLGRADDHAREGPRNVPNRAHPAPARRERGRPR